MAGMERNTGLLGLNLIGFRLRSSLMNQSCWLEISLWGKANISGCDSGWRCADMIANIAAILFRVEVWRGSRTQIW